MDLRDCRTVHRLLSSISRSFAERRPGSIGHITLRGKCAGARSAGNPRAACDVAGAGNGLTVRLVRHSQRKRGETDRPPRLRSTAPVLDPTAHDAPSPVRPSKCSVPTDSSSATTSSSVPSGVGRAHLVIDGVMSWLRRLYSAGRHGRRLFRRLVFFYAHSASVPAPEAPASHCPTLLASSTGRCLRLLGRSLPRLSTR